MRSLKSLTTFGLLAVATALGGCNFNASYKTSSKGLEPNELTRASAPLVERWMRRGGSIGVPVLEGAKVVETRWVSEKRSNVNGRASAELTGWMSLDDGRRIDVSADLGNDGRGWRLAAIKSDGRNLVSEEYPIQVALIEGTIGAVLESIRAKSSTTIHAHAADAYRKVTTAEETERQMKPLYTLTVQGQPLLGRLPTFRRTVDRSRPNLLLLEGHYNLGGSIMQFRLAYVDEQQTWKPVGWRVNFKPSSPPRAPEARKLPKGVQATAL